MTNFRSPQHRVAVFCRRFLPFSETFVYEELVHHDRYAADVFCVKRMNEDRFSYQPVYEGGPVYEFTRYSRAFQRRLTRDHYDLIHAHFGTGAVYAVPYVKKSGLPLVVTFHGHDVPLLSNAERLYPQFWAYGLLGRGVLETMSLGLCASVELLEMLADLGVPRDKLRLHHIGLDTHAFQPKPRDANAEPLVLMVGRFVQKKGLHYGIRAFAAACRNRPGRMIIVGDGPLKAELQRAAADEGMAMRVDFAGVLTHRETATLLQTADVLLAPSVTTADGDRESGLMVVKEASASGAVPIATWHGGIPEIIDDGKTGFLVAERDVPALAERLSRLLDQPLLRTKLATAARQRMVERFDIRARVRDLEDAYDAVTGRKSQSSSFDTSQRQPQPGRG